MNNKKEFYAILEQVRSLVNEIDMEKLYPNCNIDVLINETNFYRVIIEFSNCIGEIIVNQPDFAPYRYVKFEIISSITPEYAQVFVWYDNETNTVEEILTNIQNGLKIGYIYS